VRWPLTVGVSWNEEEIGDRVAHPLDAGRSIWDCATAPSYRRLRLYTTLLIYIADGAPKAYAESGSVLMWIIRLRKTA
jgi:hypothetical protein